ncbi:MAG: ATP-binding protein [Ruminococcus sp.]|uniref:ATP-binding protein n=1 Tax=Ruminococcus sp. TaxID=41978 RepID=UPI0025EA09C7|nr:ATP-binding protein [Ruminococcus sp.]MBO4866562.1 ATP-binding protein [Ruminococcus sp.]
MTDFNRILKQIRSLVIFKELRKNDVITDMIQTMISICEEDTEMAVEWYSDMCGDLYKSGDDLTEYIMKIILEDENLFILKKGEGLETGTMLDNCLANELAFLEELATIPSSEFIGRINYDGFLPEYRISPRDFSQIYAQRVHEINKIGYGIYSKYNIFIIKDGVMTPVEHADPIMLSQLHNYENERSQVIANTKALIAGKPANNVLLYGDCGTGKSSTVKAIANEFACEGLRLIELKKKQLHEIPNIVETISKNPLKFIIFIDDLSFTEDDNDYAALKAILEGSVASTASNLVIYATSNRRHLVRETFTSRKGDEIHFKDTVQELLSLSDRFGLTVTFQKPDKKLFLDLVNKLADQYEISTSRDELEIKAEAFALSKGGRSPRVAKQFIEYVKGTEE